MKKSGKINLKHNLVFVWSLSDGKVPEIFGHVQTPTGATVKGTSGWYRTDDPQKAAKVAQSNLK